MAGGIGLPAGCAPARHRLAGDEAIKARDFFAAAVVPSFPIEATYSGIAEVAGRSLPFVAGVNSRGPSEETVGVYDPLGRALLFVSNDGTQVTVLRGPAASDFPSLRNPGWEIPAAGVSLGRILSGAPGYVVDGGDLERTPEGGWVLKDERQSLFSDPSRRFLSRGEYRFSGKLLIVTYPERASAKPHPQIRIESVGANIVLRRDEE